MHIHSRALKYFDMIQRCGSIREAARRLHVSSSAVNRQLLQLEGEVGSPLFERGSAYRSRAQLSWRIDTRSMRRGYATGDRRV